MTNISQLSSLDQIQAGDLLAIWDGSNSDTRKGSIALLVNYLNTALTFPSAGKADFIIQRASPSATGFTVAINDDSNNNWLILTPTAGYANGTLTLPAVANVVDKQEILVNCTQQVTTLTIDANGATAVTGAPVALGADDFFKLKFDDGTKTWYRVG